LFLATADPQPEQAGIHSHVAEGLYEHQLAHCHEAAAKSTEPAVFMVELGTLVAFAAFAAKKPEDSAA
jgi:hypothetical protein